MISIRFVKYEARNFLADNKRFLELALEIPDPARVLSVRKGLRCASLLSFYYRFSSWEFPEQLFEYNQHFKRAFFSEQNATVSFELKQEGRSPVALRCM